VDAQLGVRPVREVDDRVGRLPDAGKVERESTGRSSVLDPARQKEERLRLECGSTGPVEIWNDDYVDHV
jgi:hypothetical protein